MKITTEQIEKLADLHIRHYEALIFGARNVRVAECKNLIRIWNGVKYSLSIEHTISSDGKNEIIDAITSGEYDALFPEVTDMNDVDFEFPFEE